jgi:hypothetical protein
MTKWRSTGDICIGRGASRNGRADGIAQGLNLAEDLIVVVLSACLGVGLRCQGSIRQGLYLLSNFGEGGAEFIFNFLKLFLVQFIASPNLSPKFNKLFHECGGVKVLALRSGVVRSDRVTLSCWLVLRFLPQLRACRSLVVVDLLLSSIVIWWPCGASRSRQSWR